MYCIETIKALNAKPKIIRDNWNRDSSFVKSHKGFVIHSGVHRSTAFIGETDHADCHFAFTYWSRQGQAAINAFIEVIIDGGSLETAEENAFRKALPAWQVIAPSAKGTQGNRHLTAVLPGKLETRVGAYTFRHLHSKVNSDTLNCAAIAGF